MGNNQLDVYVYIIAIDCACQCVYVNYIQRCSIIYNTISSEFHPKLCFQQYLLLTQKELTVRVFSPAVNFINIKKFAYKVNPDEVVSSFFVVIYCGKFILRQILMRFPYDAQ